MSLRLSNFNQWIQGGEPIDYLEVRLGEQYAVPFTIKDNQVPPQPINLTGWSFANVTSQIYTATFAYNSAGTLTSVTDFVQQGTAGTVSGLEVVDINVSAGTGVLKIPAAVNPNPTTLITPDGNNTMLNIITITASYPSSVSGFNSIRKLLIGLIVRFGS